MLASSTPKHGATWHCWRLPPLLSSLGAAARMNPGCDASFCQQVGASHGAPLPPTPLFVAHFPRPLLSGRPACDAVAGLDGALPKAV